MVHVVKYVKGKGDYKYTAILSDGKRVNFGNKHYQHYKDSVPKNLGGGIWSSKDHNDKKRRAAYRKRHSKIKLKDGRYSYQVKYTPAWFSYYYLW